MGNPGTSNRSVEGFVSWKDPPTSAGRGRISHPSTNSSGGRKNREGSQNHSTDERVTSPDVSIGGGRNASTHSNHRHLRSEEGVLASSTLVSALQNCIPSRFIPTKVSVGERTGGNNSHGSLQRKATRHEGVTSKEGTSMRRSSSVSSQGQQPLLRTRAELVEEPSPGMQAQSTYSLL